MVKNCLRHQLRDYVTLQLFVIYYIISFNFFFFFFFRTSALIQTRGVKAAVILHSRIQQHSGAKHITVTLMYSRYNKLTKAEVPPAFRSQQNSARLLTE